MLMDLVFCCACNCIDNSYDLVKLHVKFVLCFTLLFFKLWFKLIIGITKGLGV